MSKKRKITFIVLAAIILLSSVLPIALVKDAALSRYSFIYIAFAVCSVVYAGIAFIFKNKGNLFVIGKNRFISVLSLSFSEEKSYADSEEYKKEFALSAVIYCVTVPPYITLAFFARDYYLALSGAFSLTVLRHLAIIIIVIVPSIIKNIKQRKQQQKKDEADRKEQERRESMGKWK